MSEVLATYRLQLHAGFPLAAARELVPYLAELGVTHLHLSPVLRSRQGSTHGYDVVDPTVVDPELGGEEELERLVQVAREYGLGIVQDIVPNHMAASAENPAWEDVLAHGPASPYARWFDIEWRTAEPGLRSRVLLPVLGDTRPRVLARGELALAFEDGRFRVRYHEHGFPVDPATLLPVLETGVQRSREVLSDGHPAIATLRDIVALVRGLPRRTTRSTAALERRRRNSEAALGMLQRLALGTPAVAVELARAARELGAGDEGRERLRRFLDTQAYRLVNWRRAARELNYRRFFDVNELVALHMEDPEVFAQTHARILAWVRDGKLDALRVDHPDGLLDPLAYLRWLTDGAFAWRADGRYPVFVEKILSGGERLRDAWPVAGTTGYDFLNQAEALWIDPAGYERVEADYRRLIRRPLDFAAVARLGKRKILETSLSSGVRYLARRLQRLAPADPTRPPVPASALATAIVEAIVYLPVYRTYLDEHTPEPQGEDRRLLEATLAETRARGRARPEALDLLEAALLARDGPMRAPGVEPRRRRFAQRFQQLSGPATAKGIEDTAFYAYAPLLSRAEVGGAPAAPLDAAVAEFHAGNAHRAERWPHGLTAVTTHDTKRTADVRARLDVLSELPEEWEERVYRWRKWNRRREPPAPGRRRVDPATILHLYQALVGIWPMAPAAADVLGDQECLRTLRGRLVEYAIKATREAKTQTSWVDPDEDFEAAVRAYVERILTPARSPEFMADLDRFVRRIARLGLWNSIARVVLQVGSPGAPDVYQGDELWNFALVDPDNRRPVDFETRRHALERVAALDGAAAGTGRAALDRFVAEPESGLLKLHVLRAALHARRANPELFRSTAYLPLQPEGPAAEHVVAFARSAGDAWLVAAVPRLLARLTGHGARPPTDPAPWAGTSVKLPPGRTARRWRSALTGDIIEAEGGRLPAPELFGRIPAALLIAESAFPD